MGLLRILREGDGMSELSSFAYLLAKVIIYLVFALAPIDVVVIAYQQF